HVHRGAGSRPRRRRWDGPGVHPGRGPRRAPHRRRRPGHRRVAGRCRPCPHRTRGGRADAGGGGRAGLVPAPGSRTMTRDRTAGITLALGAAAVSGVAVFVNSYGVRAVPDATVYTTAKNLVAAIVLAVGAALVARPWRRADQLGRRVDRPGRRRLRPRQIVGLVAVAATGGSIGFVLFFEGLA